MDNTTRQEIEKIAKEHARVAAKEEVDLCMATVQGDIREIKEALLGNAEYGSQGLIKDVEPIRVWWRQFAYAPEGEKSKKRHLNEMISFWTKVKWLAGLVTALGIINGAELVRRVIVWLSEKS